MKMNGTSWAFACAYFARSFNDDSNFLTNFNQAL